MRRLSAMWLASASVVLLSSNARAQQVRADVGLTTEQHGVSINVEARYYNSKYKMFALGRMFINEPDSEEQQQSIRTENPLAVEVAVGRLFQRSPYVVGPLVGIDSNKRIIAGADFLTKVRNHTLAYLGYAKLATDPAHSIGMRHRLMFDLKKDEKLFLRLDWKTQGRKQGHSRLGVEFHTRVNKLNLPVYLEPFWNFAAHQPGIRAGTRL